MTPKQNMNDRVSIHASPAEKLAECVENDGETLDKNQSYWSSQVATYELPDSTWGPEVAASLAGASRVFWQQQLPEDRFKQIMSLGKVPQNCPYLKVLRVNPEIFTTTSPSIRTGDVSLQQIQEVHVALTSCLVQALSSMESLKDSETGRDKVTDALVLSGKMNMLLNQHRRDAFKPTIPPEKKGIIELPLFEPADTDFLFGDNLDETLAEIKKKNNLKKEFSKKTNEGRKPPYTKKTGYSGGDSSSSNKEKKSGYAGSENERANQKSRGGSHQGRNKSKNNGSNNSRGTSRRRSSTSRKNR